MNSSAQIKVAPKAPSLKDRLRTGISSLVSSFRGKFHTALAITSATLAIASSAGAQTRPTVLPDATNRLGNAESVVATERDKIKNAREHASVERGILNVMQREHGTIRATARRQAATEAYLLNQLVIGDRPQNVHTNVDYDTATGLIRASNSDHVQVHRVNDADGTHQWYAVSVTPGSGGSAIWTSGWHLLSEASNTTTARAALARRASIRRATQGTPVATAPGLVRRSQDCTSTRTPATPTPSPEQTPEPLPEYLQPTCEQIATIATNLNSALRSYGIRVSCDEMQRGDNVHTALTITYHGATASIPVAVQRREYNDGRTTSFLLTTSPTTRPTIDALDANHVLASFNTPISTADLNRGSQVVTLGGDRMLLPGITADEAVSRIGQTGHFYGFGATNTRGTNIPTSPNLPPRTEFQAALRTLLVSLVTTAPVRPVNIRTVNGDVLAANHPIIGSHGQVNPAFSPEQINEIVMAAGRVLHEQVVSLGNAAVATHIRTRLTPTARSQAPTNARQKPSDEVSYLDPESAKYRAIIGEEDNTMVTPGVVANMFQAMRTTATPTVVVDSLAYTPSVRNAGNGSGAVTEFADTTQYIAGLDQHYARTRREATRTEDSKRGAHIETFASPQEAAVMLAQLEAARPAERTLAAKARTAMSKVLRFFRQSNTQVA